MKGMAEPMNKKRNGFTQEGKRFSLYDPLSIPKADTFLWNDKTLCHITVQGFMQSQFMQPEPCFYSHPPLMSAKAAMAPEPQYFDHFPGRFFYIRDDENMEYFSVPYRPTNIPLDEFEFSVGLSDVKWTCKKNDIKVTLQCALPKGSDIVELWKISVKNESKSKKNISVFPYFPIGFPSWMNTMGSYSGEVGGILAYTLTPYRKLEDYYKNSNLKDYCYLASDKECDYWNCSQLAFEGNNGLRRPDALEQENLPCLESSYETTACTMQYKIQLDENEEETINFIFGPAKDIAEIEKTKEKYLNNSAMGKAIAEYDDFYNNNKGCIQVESGDDVFDNFVNHWMPRQAIYLAQTLRMVTDPQTRNHIQDAMCMTFIKPDKAKELYRIGLQQQKSSGEMLDGILLREDAQLKFTNQIPHRDPSIWWAYAIETYINETNDYEFLKEEIAFSDSEQPASVYEHVCRGIEWIIQDRSPRGLCLIGQGDWNDPMNMVGHKGKGESVWLTQAMVFAMRIWIGFCKQFNDFERVEKYEAVMLQAGELLNTLCWDGEWYARGITDEGVLMGVKTDNEGKIFLNTQSFGILSGCATNEQINKIVSAVTKQMETPYGVELLTPSYTHMREDVGRVTQKHPSTGENGSIYSHANLFYTYALYQCDCKDIAYRVMRKIISGATEDELKQREHIPVYIPNYYRGSHNPRMIGKSSHLMNTGALSWFYKSVVEGMLGLIGVQGGMIIKPQLPKHMTDVKIRRTFRNKTFSVTIIKDDASLPQIILNEAIINGNFIKDEEMLENNILIIRVAE